MGYYTPAEIVEVTVDKGIEKANGRFGKLMALGTLGGAYISLGYLAYLRIAGSMTGDLAGLGTFLGACIFPIGLIAVLLGGGELLTGNMLVVAVACFRGRVKPGQLMYNWAVITFSNLIGAMAVAYFFGHVAGLTEGSILEETLHVAQAKVDASFVRALVSGIGCNIFVGLGVWLCYGAKDVAGKVLAIWFPVMVFVAIGFQHVVANMFVIPAAIFSGHSTLTWLDFLMNVVPVFIGNAIGGALCLGLPYCLAYRSVGNDDSSAHKQDHKAA